MKKIYFLFFLILVIFLSGKYNFALAAIPLTPQLISPTDGASAIALPTLRWTDVANKAQNEYYNVLLKSSAESDWHSAGLKLTVNEVTLTGLDTSVTYSWMVETCYEVVSSDGNDEVCGPRSSTWSFTTAISAVAPAKPSLIAPGNGDVFDEASPVLQWTDTVSAGGWYRVYYKKITDSTFTDVGYDISVNSRMIYLDSLSKEGTYQWYVKACNSATLCTDSDVWSFIVVECTDNTWCPSESTCVGNVCKPLVGSCDSECNGTCGAGCTIKQDPDCGCSKTLVNNCCPAVKLCTPDNDIDCSADCANENESCKDVSCCSGLDCGSGQICVAKSLPPTGGSSGLSIDNPLQSTSFEELLDLVTNIMFWIALALVPLLFIIAALYFVTSAGDPGKLETAKKIMLYTIIGLVIILLAKGLVRMVISFIGG